MKADVAPAMEKPKIPQPTVSQINSDRITQVSVQSEVTKIVSQYFLKSFAIHEKGLFLREIASVGLKYSYYGIHFYRLLQNQ